MSNNGKVTKKIKKIKGDGDMSKTQLYTSPVVLNSVAHKDLKIAPISSFAYAKPFNSCVILCQEFLEAAKYYPIIFSRAEDVFTPIVLLGLNDNMFIADGTWQAGTYIPAFIRRYPYILAEGLAQDGSLTVCIDADYEGFNKEEGERLFTDEGEQTPALARAIEFLTLYQNQFEVTKAFITTIKDLDIFKSVDATITLASGKTFTINNIWMVDEQKMLELPDADLLNLVKRGYLAWIYAHLYSLTNFAKISSTSEE
jgi:hypothetical protein